MLEKKNEEILKRTWEMIGVQNLYDSLNVRYSQLVHELTSLRTEASQYKSMYNECELGSKVYREKAFKAVNEVYDLKQENNRLVRALLLAGVDWAEYEFVPKWLKVLDDMVH